MINPVILLSPSTLVVAGFVVGYLSSRFVILKALDKKQDIDHSLLFIVVIGYFLEQLLLPYIIKAL